MARRAFVPLATFVAVFAACTSLKRAEEAPPVDEGGTSEAGPTSESGGPVDAPSADTGRDVGAPPNDFECADEWTAATKTKTECFPRQVKVITAVAPIDVNAVSIARTPAGRVGIVYNSEQSAETGEMHLMHFTPATPTYPAPVLVKRATGFAFHDGYVSKIAASAPDTLALLTFDMDDTSYSGEVHLRKLVAGKEPLTDDKAFAPLVKSPTEIAIASDAAGTVWATVRIATSATMAKLAASTKTPTSAFTPLPDLASNMLPAEAPGVGAASMVLDDGGQVNLLFHHTEVPLHSTPRYHQLAATTWSFRKTVDNAIADGLSGYSPRIAVFGTKKYAAYFFRKAGQSPPQFATADLRLATWEAATDTPAVEILVQGIPSPDPKYPKYAVAMAVDKYGLAHVAILSGSSTTAGTLEYRRQTPIAGGGTKWLRDIVDADVFGALDAAFVDMVVDDAARPHIAYRSGKDGKIRYATRFDR